MKLSKGGVLFPVVEVSAGDLVEEVEHKVSLHLVDLDVDDDAGVGGHEVPQPLLAPGQPRSQHYPPLLALGEEERKFSNRAVNEPFTMPGEDPCYGILLLRV